MDKKEVIKSVLGAKGTCSATEIRKFAFSLHNEDISVGSISGILRTMIAKQEAAVSKNADGKNVYWLLNIKYK